MRGQGLFIADLHDLDYKLSTRLHEGVDACHTFIISSLIDLLIYKKRNDSKVCQTF